MKTIKLLNGKLIFLIFAFVSLLVTSCRTSSNFTTVDIPPTSKLIEVNGSKDELFIRANDWMVNSFNNAKSVIQFSDKETGIITGKYLMKVIYITDGWITIDPSKEIYAIIKVQVKDGASKVTITPSSYQYYTGFGQQSIHRFSSEEAQSQINELIISFENFMNDSSDDF